MKQVNALDDLEEINIESEKTKAVKKMEILDSGWVQD